MICVKCKRDRSLSSYEGNLRHGGLYKTCDVCREKRRVSEIEVGTMITDPCSFCGEPMYRMYMGGRKPTVCSKPECDAARKAKNQRRLYKSNKEGMNPEGKSVCSACKHYAYCKRIVFTILPVPCQVEMTVEQKRVIRSLPFDVQAEIVFGGVV